MTRQGAQLDGDLPVTGLWQQISDPEAMEPLETTFAGAWRRSQMRACLLSIRRKMQEPEMRQFWASCDQTRTSKFYGKLSWRTSVKEE